MIWYAAAMPGRLEDETELVADPRLPLEVSQSGGSEHGFGRTLGRVGVRTYQRGQVLIACVAHVLPLPRQALQGGSHQDRDIDLWIFMH
jgi:hypothetical protein